MAEIPCGGEDFVTDPPEEERVRYYSRAEVDEAVAKERGAAFAAGIQAGREAERTEAVDLLADLVDPDACSYDHHDHHGHCQAHGWLYPSRCPHARAKEYGAKTHQKEER